jgi:hypothetical protein
MADARLRLERASEDLRQRTQISTLVKKQIPHSIGGFFQRHPLPIALGTSAMGFLVARALTRPRKTSSGTSISSTPAKALILLLTKSLLKPVLKDVLLRSVRQGLRTPPGGKH